MRAVNPQKLKNQKFKDNLARQRQRRFVIKASGLAIVVLLLLGAMGWALFFSGWFDIRSVAVNGLSNEHASEVQAAIDQQLSKKFIGLPYGRNILFFKDNLATTLKGKFGFLDDLKINRQFFHALAVTGVERQAAGVWCFNSADCRYFDWKGNSWGNAISSSGFLTLNVNDLRSPTEEEIDQQFLPAIKTVVDYFRSQDYPMRGISIPADNYTEFDLDAGEYPVKFSTDSSVSQQLDVYKIFKEQKIDTDQVAPEYLDLRYDGRVYYK